MNDQSIIKVSGRDALDFLQGQLSNDLRNLELDASVRAALCNPKGRVICLLLVTRDKDGFSLLLPADLADDIVQRLTMFRFRAKVEFESEAANEPVDSSVLIRDGIPHIGREQSEKFTSHMLNLDLLDAIDFDKGCYTGQEVIARTHFKGATKRRTLRFESAAQVSVGDKVSDGSRDIGEVLNVSASNSPTSRYRTCSSAAAALSAGESQSLGQLLRKLAL